MKGYPLPGEELLEAIAALGELVQPWHKADNATIAAAAETVFVKSEIPAGHEGFLLGFGFEWEPEDLQTSPVWVARVNGDTFSRTKLGPYKTAIGTMNRPFYLPERAPLFLRSGDQVGLVLKNGEASGSHEAFGQIFGVFWSEEDLRRVREAIVQRGGRPWPKGGLG